MTIGEKETEILIDYACPIYYEQTSEDEHALKIPECENEQFKELIHKACHNFMQDLGERLGHIQLKAAAAMNKFSYDEDMLNKLDEIISATSAANKFMLTLEDYFMKELNNQINK